MEVRPMSLPEEPRTSKVVWVKGEVVVVMVGVMAASIRSPMATFGQEEPCYLKEKLIFHCTTPDTSQALKNVDHLLWTLDLSLTRAVAVFIGARRLRGLVGRFGDIYYYGPAGHQMIPLSSSSAVTCCFVRKKFAGFVGWI